MEQAPPGEQHLRIVANGHLDRFDVLVVPGGSGRAKAEILGTKGCDEIRRFVSRGGGYIGICGGSYLATSGYEWSLGISPVKTLTGVLPGGGGTWPDRGVGDVSVQFTRVGRSFLGLKETVAPMRFSNGPIMTPISTDRNDARQGFAVLATYKSELYRHVKQIGTMTGTPAIVSSRFGQGTVLLFSTHPEGSPRCSGVLSRSIRLVAPRRSSTDA
ncbi:MAG: hypothetical protein JSS49_13995 [Planctomycetes bacterium]|nr:hypothetical protein [Planctomycetota bacterium]